MTETNNNSNNDNNNSKENIEQKENSVEKIESLEDPPEFDYDDLMEEYSLDHEKFERGSVVEGTIMRKEEKGVLVDIGYKSEGIIPIEEFEDREGNVEVEEGDKVEVAIEEVEDPDGDVILSYKKARLMKAWDKVEKAYENDETITGEVIRTVKGGMEIDVGVRAFLPGSLVDTRRVKDLESYVGREFEMKILKVNRQRNNIVLSRKAVLEMENAEKKQKTLDELEIGKKIEGTIKNLTEYGAFVDLGGIDGLLHITDMSWGRVNHPSEIFAIDDEVEVIVLDYDLEEERVSLGYKQKSPDPWENVEEKFPEGAKVKGKVVSMTGYGAFVELSEGVEGLIHISEMSWIRNIKHPSQVLNVGDTVECKVLDIDSDNRRISLGLKQTKPNPWDVIQAKYKVGDVIEGKVRNLTEFGAFIEVQDGVDGLVHISDMSWTERVEHPSEILEKGETAEAKILEINPEEERISLGIKQLEPSAWERFFEEYRVGDEVTGKVVRLTDFGAFIEVAEGVEGLAHISELSDRRIDKPSDELSVGEEVEMKIIKMDRNEKKIGLSKRALIEEQRDETEEAQKSSIQLSDILGKNSSLKDYQENMEEKAEVGDASREQDSEPVREVEEETKEDSADSEVSEKEEDTENSSAGNGDESGEEQEDETDNKDESQD